MRRSRKEALCIQVLGSETKSDEKVKKGSTIQVLGSETKSDEKVKKGSTIQVSGVRLRAMRRSRKQLYMMTLQPHSSLFATMVTTTYVWGGTCKSIAMSISRQPCMNRIMQFRHDFPLHIHKQQVKNVYIPK